MVLFSCRLAVKSSTIYWRSTESVDCARKGLIKYDI